jgi:hypothetical protein
MTTKKKVIIGVVAGWVVLSSLFWIGAGVTKRSFSGMVFSGSPGNATVAVKDFEPVELVFVTTTAKKKADVNVNDLLLKEAQKVGGHAIINVNIDSQRKGLFGEVTLTASALAIKYTDAIEVPTTDTGIASLRWSGFGRNRW